MPTEQLIERVKQLRAQGLSIAAIAQLVGLHKNTLFRHYSDAIGSRSMSRLRFADPDEVAQYPRPALGRPRHVPTIATSARVRQLVRDGASVPVIASDLGIAPQTLQRHYARELARRDSLCGDRAAD